MSSKLEPTIWSRDTGQQIPCIDRCQLTITWMSKIKEMRYKPRVHAILRDSVVVVRTRPRAMSLAMKTMRKSIHGFPFLPYIIGMGLHLAAFRAAEAPLLIYTLGGFFHLSAATNELQTTITCTPNEAKNA